MVTGLTPKGFSLAVLLAGEIDFMWWIFWIENWILLYSVVMVVLCERVSAHWVMGMFV